MPETERTGLVRAIGRWSLAALVVNSIIGSGIFVLPADVARLIGAASPWAVLLAGAAAGVIMACFAEVASQFTAAGGPYLYTRAAFGRLVGIEMGWMLWLVRLAAPAATANLFVIYCGEFWPHATKPLPRFLILTLLYGILTLINYRGVRASTRSATCLPWPNWCRFFWSLLPERSIYWPATRRTGNIDDWGRERRMAAGSIASGLRLRRF